MDEAELKVIAALLELAGDTFSNHGCNDFDLLKACGGDEESARLIALRYWAHVGEAEVWEQDLFNIGDDGLMYFFAERIKKQSTQ